VTLYVLNADVVDLNAYRARRRGTDCSHLAVATSPVAGRKQIPVTGSAVFPHRPVGDPPSSAGHRGDLGDAA
jgi:hypothetical protein